MGGEKDAFCSWKGVRCRDGIIESICARRSPHDKTSVLMEWMPPTVKFIHFDKVLTIGEWGMENLPRQLRYLCLMHCHRSRSSQQLYWNKLRKLPPKMEELIIDRTPIPGVLQFDQIPQTMRYIYIKIPFRTSSYTVYVDHEFLPMRMNHLFVTCDSKDLITVRFKVKGFSECAVRSKLKKHFGSYSEYFGGFENTLEMNETN